MTESNAQSAMIGGSDASTDETAQAMSLMGGIVGPEGLPELEQIGGQTPKARRRLLTQGTMLILVVFVIAAGTLYGMRLSQRHEGPSAQVKSAEAKIDQALAKLSNPTGVGKDDPLQSGNIDKLFQDTDSLVSVFSADMTARQVPAQFVKKNPFVFPVFQSVPMPGEDRQAQEEKSKKARLSKLQGELDRLELQSIMQGARPVAVINSELVQPGQTVNGFTVKAIHDFWVQMEAEGELFTLRMPRPEDKKNKQKGRRSFGTRR